MATRQEALRGYLREVALDLCRRGLVRHHQGWTVTQILQQEPATVFGSIVRDLTDAGLSVKDEIVGEFLGSVGRAVRDTIFGKRG